jgi:hypothetical protein
MDHPHAYPSLYELGQRLRAHNMETSLRDGKLLVLAEPSDDGSPRPGGAVECRVRTDDGDRLWFFVDDQPVEEASHVTDAAVAIAARLHRQHA